MNKKNLLILTIILSLVMLLSACKKEQDVSNKAENTQTQENGGNDLGDFFSTLSPNLEYKVKYDVKTTSGNKTTSMIQTMALKGKNSMVSIESKSMSSSVYTIDGKSYTCTISGNNKMCFESPGSTSQTDTTVKKNNDLRENWKNYNVASKGTRTIAGKPAICFSYSVSGNTVENCLSQEGVPVYMKMSASNVEAEYTATEYSASVSDSEFELPAEPQKLPG
jgi:hypothetical protein